MDKSYAAGQAVASTLARGTQAAGSVAKHSVLGAKSFAAGFMAGWKLGALNSVPSTQVVAR